ncbi:MAG: hypothetical protein HS117_10030 [Verrucomicrobiaceae bacterium]|nr:hypothetical protein [Verrucomicrobiaceae bacterium]
MRRRLSTRRSSSRWLVWLCGCLLALALLLVLALPALVTGYLQRLIRADDFHQTAAGWIEGRFGGRASLSPLVWHDDSAALAAVSVETASGWQLEGAGVQAAVNFGAIRRGAWHIQNVGVEALTLTQSGSPSAHASDGSADTTLRLPAWIDRHVPKTIELDGLDAEQFQLVLGGGWQLAQTRLHLGSYDSAAAGPGRFSIPGRVEGGHLQTPLQPPGQDGKLRLDLRSAAFRLTEDRLQVTESTLRWKETATAGVRGNVRFRTGAWQASIHATQVPVGGLLAAGWQQHLSGRLEGGLECSGGGGQPLAWTADLALKDGVLTALPVLDKLAAYTRMERFKRLILDIATATAAPLSGGGTRVEKIIVQSNGLLRIEGALRLQPGGAIDGDFMLGVTPETLRWLPGAENRVFIETHPQGPPGLHWTRVKVAGTTAAPQEDLSARLLGAAGMSLLLDTPGAVVDKAADVLVKPLLGQDAAKLPGQLLDGTSKTLENGVKTGAGLLNKVIPVFPGK